MPGWDAWGDEIISIHALREEGDKSFLSPFAWTWRFLSTPSARRATGGGGGKTDRPTDFYPRPPRGGRLVAVGAKLTDRQISIHALREEGDLCTF